MSVTDSLPAAAKTALEAPSDQSLRVPCYCEENVWRLAYRKEHSSEQERYAYFVAFVTNPQGCVPMFEQLAAADRNRPCFWDYHVILIRQSIHTANDVHVLDIDSHLPYPSSLREYLSEVFPAEVNYPEEYLPFFR